MFDRLKGKGWWWWWWWWYIEGGGGGVLRRGLRPLTPYNRVTSKLYIFKHARTIVICSGGGGGGEGGFLGCAKVARETASLFGLLYMNMCP